MISYQNLSKRPKVFIRLTSLAVDEFERLHDKFVSAWKVFVHEEFIKGKNRKRKYGGGNTPRLQTSRDKLLFALIYIRLYPLQVVQGMWFDLDESNANRWIHRLVPLVNQALDYEHVLPKRGRGRSLDEIIAEYPDLKDILTDGVEQPIRRPKDKDEQRDKYSGKKKRHTKKQVVITHPNTQAVIYTTPTYPGKAHDKTIIESQDLRASPDILVGGDKGFQGLEIGEAKIITPTKKPKGKELPVDIQKQNQAFSSMRISVEHAINGIKRANIASDIYRNMKHNFDDLSFLTAIGLHNFRVKHRYATTN